MASATVLLPSADQLHGQVAFAETMALAAQLADALHILTQCSARNVPISEEFLAYVDDLTEEIEMLQPCGMISRA